MNQYAPPQANLDHTPGDGNITPAMVESLRKTKFGTRLISVMLYFAALLSVLGGLALMIGFQGKGTEFGARGATIALGAFYVLFALIYGMLATHLYRYGTAIADFVSDGNSALMEAALAHQQKFWRLAGTLALLLLLAMLLGIASAIIIPMILR